MSLFISSMLSLQDIAELDNSLSMATHLTTIKAMKSIYISNSAEIENIECPYINENYNTKERQQSAEPISIRSQKITDTKSDLFR